MDKIKETVNNYPTKYKEGFIESELKDILSKFENINMDKVNNAMMGNTCMVIDGEIINYHCDVELAIRCGIGNRNPYFWEWD